MACEGAWERGARSRAADEAESWLVKMEGEGLVFFGKSEAQTKRTNNSRV